MNKIVTTVLKYSRLGLVKRYYKYQEFTKLLNIKGGFVFDIHDLYLENGKLYSTGEDPNISIKLFSVCNSFDIDYKVSFDKEELKLYYIPKVVKNGAYAEHWTKKIGICDGTENFKKIKLYDKTRNIRIDFGEKQGLIDINHFKIICNNCDFNNREAFQEVIKTINKKNPNKIVIVSHALNETGAPILAYNIAKKFKEKGYETVVLSLSGGYLTSKLEENEIPLFNLNQGGVNDKIINNRDLDYIVKSLYQLGFTKVLTNTIISGLTTPVFKKYGFEIVSLIHEMKCSIENYNMLQSGYNIDLYADKIVFPDKIVANEFYDLYSNREKVEVIAPQGVYRPALKIDINKKKICEKYNIPEKARIIVGSGTADFRKGIDLFLTAAQELIKIEDNNEYHFIWAGKIIDKNLETWFKCQFDRFKITNRIHIIDFIKDKNEYQNLISCADAFWLTSREDPFPSVMIESLEYKTPVIAFKNCGGANTLLACNRGILIDNFDVYQMAKETNELINNPDKIKKQLKQAQDYIKENLNFDNYISKLDSLYENFPKIEYADLSVIVPNYNYEDYLPIRLNSIINQTIKPKEIIFLDDVSYDDSVKVAKEILNDAKKKYGIDYKIIVNTENNGCFRQWLKGIKLAKYEYVWIAEADDFAHTNFVETLMKGFEKKDVVLSYCQSKVIDEYGQASKYDYKEYTNDLDEDKWKNDFVDSGNDQIKKYFYLKNIIPNVSSTIIKKSATIGLEKELSKYNIIGDWLAYIYILNKGKVYYSSKIMNGHRRHSKSIIAKKENSPEFIMEILKIKKYILDNLELKDQEINKIMLSIDSKDLLKIQDNQGLYNEYRIINILANKLRKKKNLLIIIPDLEVGGGQSVGIRLANNFTKYYNVFLVNARNWLETKIMTNMINDNVTLLKCEDYNSLREYNFRLNFTAEISLIWWADKLAYQAFKDEKIKMILSMHGDYEMLLHNPNVDNYFNENYVELLNRQNYIVYTAEKNKEVLIKTNLINNSNVSKIDNGFILGDYPHKDRSQLGIKENDFVFGLVARAIPEKGYEEAIKALNLLNKRISKKAHLILVGASEYTKKLKAQYASEVIHFIDEFSLPNEWLGWEEIFDVGILPSYFKSESLPTVIIENLFLGNPFIATDIAEIKSMLIDEESQAGIVVPLKDGKADINELANAMEKLIADKELFKKLKENTVKFSNRFNMNKCIENYRKLIEEDQNE